MGKIKSMKTELIAPEQNAMKKQGEKQECETRRSGKG